MRLPTFYELFLSRTGVGNVILGQFLYGSENRVVTTGAKCRMKREVAHQISSYILNTLAATEVNAH